MAGQPTLIASVQRALSLLDVVGAAERPLPAKTLARRAGLPLPTAYHLLRTLVHEGYLERVDGAGYLLGARAQELAARPGARVRAVHRVLDELHVELGAAAYLSTYADGEVRLTDLVDSPAAPRVDLWVGFGDAAHATALGKAVLAALAPDQQRDFLARHPMPDLTPHTHTDVRALLRELAADGRYAVDREEYSLGTACLAVPVPASRVAAAVAVSVPSHRLPDVIARADVVRRAARQVALDDAPR